MGIFNAYITGPLEEGEQRCVVALKAETLKDATRECGEVFTDGHRVYDIVLRCGTVVVARCTPVNCGSRWLVEVDE